MLTPDGVVASWNPGAQNFKGYAAEEIIGKNFSCFYTADDQAAGLPARNLRTAASIGTFESEGWRVRNDGSTFWARCIIDPVRDESGQLLGYAKITRDITARKQAYDALRESEQRFRHLVNGVTDYAIYMLTLTGKITNWNAGAQRITGYTEKEAIGMHFSRFYIEEESAAGMPKKALDIAAGAGKFQSENWCVRKDGSRFWAHVAIDPVHDDDGKLIGFANITRDITEKRKTAEMEEQAQSAIVQAQALRESEKRLQQLANTMPQLAWMAHPDGMIHWYNDRWYEYTGATPADMEGWGWQTVHHPDVLPSVMALWKESLVIGKPFQMTFPLRGANGSFRPFFTLVSPLRDESGEIIQWFGTNTDVSPLQEAERALRQSEERLQQGLLAARMMVWDWDLRTNQVKLSSNAATLFGRTWEDPAEGWKTVHPEDVPKLTDAVNRAIEARSEYQMLVRMIRPDNGDMLWMDVRGSVVCDEAGEPRAIRGICLDVTERTRAAEELRAADRRKDEFLAMLAHELRNPLAPISTAAELLKIPAIAPELTRQTSEIIARQVQHMTRLVDDLLDVSKVTRGLVTLEKEAVDLKTIVNSAIEQVRPLIESRRHDLTVRATAPHAFVEGDRIRLVQVVANLLNNAAKYTPEGGKIALAIEVEETAVKLSVRDNGMGIAPGLLARVFDLFAQGERTPDRSQGGLGLGLALVKNLVGLHGGTVMACSDGQDRGSIFTITLPLMAAPLSRLLPSSEAEAAQATRPLRIMIVDDNADAAETLGALLHAAGHQVSVKYDAKTALEEIGDLLPQVFILDIGLPDMDGYELARRLRSSPETENAVKIALTGYGQLHDRSLSKAAGFNHHMVKPVDIEQLANILAGVN